MAATIYGLDTISKGAWKGVCGSLARVVATQPTWGVMPAGFSITIGGTYRTTSNVPSGAEYKLLSPDGSASSNSAWTNDSSGHTDIDVTIVTPDSKGYLCSIYCTDGTYTDSTTIQVLDDSNNVVATCIRTRYLDQSFWFRAVFQGGGFKLRFPKTGSPYGRNWFNCVFLDYFDDASIGGGRFFNSL